MSPQTPARQPARRKSGGALLGSIGGYAALCILAGLGIGFLLDQVAHTTPLFLISGVVLGFVVSFVVVYRLAMKELED